MSLKSFINGLAYGFILGILFAPSSGEETRRKIAKRAADIKDSVKEKYNDIATTVTEQYGNVKNKINEIQGDGEMAYDDAKSDTANIFD